MRISDEKTRRELLRAKQTAIFRRNAMIRQKIAGVAMSLSAIAGWWFLSDKYGQFEWGLEAVIFVCCGLYLLTTPRCFYEEGA